MTQETFDKAIELKEELDSVDMFLNTIKGFSEPKVVGHFHLLFDMQYKIDRQLIETITKWLQDKGIELREEIENL